MALLERWIVVGAPGPVRYWRGGCRDFGRGRRCRRGSSGARERVGPQHLVRLGAGIQGPPPDVQHRNGSLTFMFSCSTLGENLQPPPYGPLHDYYLAQSTDGGVTWSDSPVFVADTSGGKKPNYANIFSSLGIDSAGNYYAVFAGTSDD